MKRRLHKAAAPARPETRRRRRQAPVSHHHGCGPPSVEGKTADGKQRPVCTISTANYAPRKPDWTADQDSRHRVPGSVEHVMFCDAGIRQTGAKLLSPVTGF